MTRQGFDINDIKNEIVEGLARANAYRVFIAGPNVQDIGSDITLLCEIAELPGRQFQTTEQTMYGMYRKMPYGVIYNEIVLTFAEHRDFRIRKLFDSWQRKVSDPTNNYFSYYENYIADIEIFALDPSNYARYNVLLEECYPVTISPQPLGYGEVDSYLKLSITFAYRRWRNLKDIMLGRGNRIPEKYKPAGEDVFLPDPPDLTRPENAPDPKSEPISPVNGFFECPVDGKGYTPEGNEPE
jgi:hypothetical protein